MNIRFGDKKPKPTGVASNNDISMSEEKKKVTE